MLSLYGVVALFLIFRLLWFKNLPAIFFYGLVFMWVQSFTRVFQANLENLSLSIFDQSESAAIAIFSALTSIILITLILNLILKRIRFNYENFQKILFQIDIRKTFFLFIILFFSQPILKQLAIGGLTQFVLPVLSLKWVIYCLLIYVVLLQKKGYYYLATAFTIEFLLSFGGFFSDFKNVILYSIIALLGLTKKIDNKQIIIGAFSMIPIILLISFWTFIKKDYREFLTGNERVQQVVVSRQEAVNYLLQEVKEFDKDALLNSMDPLLSRLQYTQMIQFCMDYVPAVIPFEDGRLWEGALKHILMPRFLFPDKAILDDSNVANKYTGIEWAGAAEGTSISIGFIAESYIDFGMVGLYIPIILLAILAGIIYRYFLRQTNKYIYLDYFAIIPILFPFTRIETSGNKLIGSIAMAVLVYTFIIRPILYPVFSRWLFKK